MRYARQTVLDAVGAQGQETIGAAKVLIVGLGGLGSPLALYLAAAGVGHLGLVDADTVSLSNLQRQILYQTNDCGQPKVALASARLEALNPDVRCAAYPVFLDSANAESIAADYDIIVDATDNFETKYLLNDLAVKLGKPLVFGSILRFSGQASIFWAEHGPCYRCLFPTIPEHYIPNCAEAGVLGAVAGFIGSLQALEVIKLILLLNNALPNGYSTLVGRIFTFDGQTMVSHTHRLAKDPDCPVCSINRADVVLPQLDLKCAVAEESAHKLKEHWEDYRWIDVREEAEWEKGHIPNALLWPLSRMKSGEWPVAAQRPTVVYCQSGVRSRQALALLKDQNWTMIQHLPEGFGAWAGPVEQGM
ncbi:MAG: HesA/MoeB/ThiF family protein [Chitinophagaceae bacterium]|nr:HesA/MoeB/ThiF family protein [Oligoflexus sp.]